MRIIGILAAVVVLSGCVTTQVVPCGACRPIVYPPYRGKLPPVVSPDKLPQAPDTGFLYVRVVYGYADDTAYAYVVHVGEVTRLLGIAGPLRNEGKGGGNYPAFFSKACELYGAHGPGRGVCCPAPELKKTPQGAGAGGTEKKALTPLIPPSPPPPSSGYALVYSYQDGAVDPSDPQLAGDAVGAATTGVTALNGG